MNKKLVVKCPHCGTQFSYYESEFRPFCTEKCRQIDLGHWFKESYTVPVKEDQNTKLGNEENANNIDQDEETNESEYH